MLPGCFGNSYICRHIMKKTLLFFCFLSVSIQACLDDPDCVTTTADAITIGFYEAESGVADTLVFRQVRAIGSDSILAELDTLSSIRLPLDPRGPSTAYHFDTNLGVDTLILSYTLGTRMISEECGIEFIFSELDFLRNDFDSIQIVNRIPIEEINEDIQIYN